MVGTERVGNCDPAVSYVVTEKYEVFAYSNTIIELKCEKWKKRLLWLKMCTILFSKANVLCL